MIVLVDRHGSLAQAPEAVLRLNYNRENEDFFYRAAQMPLRKWPAWRDAEISRILDSLEWMDLWNSPDGEYTVREGMGKTIASKRGNFASLIYISARRNISEGEKWHRGTPCPAAWTPEMIAERWDGRVDHWRYHSLSLSLPEDCIRTWDITVQKAARACLAAAAEGRWQDALAIARNEPYWLPLGYLETLVEG